MKLKKWRYIWSAEWEDHKATILFLLFELGKIVCTLKSNYLKIGSFVSLPIPVKQCLLQHLDYEEFQLEV